MRSTLRVRVCGEQHGFPRRSLWNSYNAGAAPLSNSYAINDRYSHAIGAELRALTTSVWSCRAEPHSPRTRYIARSIPMLDVILVAAALGFFALSIGYTIACDRL
jgi:hypothetical protein